MFDFRYHVASLAAVFVALVLGILLGIGLSGRGFVNDAERANLQDQIADLENQRDDALDLLGDAERQGRAFTEYTDDTYLAIVRGRLRDARVGVLFVGQVDQGVADAVEKAVRDAGGAVVRTISVSVPLDVVAVDEALRRRPATRGLAGPEQRQDLGRALGREYVRGGPTPLWETLSRTLVAEQAGSLRPPLDGVIVARPAPPQSGETKDVLTGLYRGVARAGEAAVGVDSASVVIAAIPAFRRAGLSTVDSIERSHGRVALVLLLAGGRSGSFGIGDNALDGVVPPVPSVPGRQ
jgi:hypothetical protein